MTVSPAGSRPAPASGATGFGPLEAVGAAILVFAPSGGMRPAYANDACCRLLGLTRGALLGDGSLAWLRPADARRLAEACRDALERGEAGCSGLKASVRGGRLRLSMQLRRFGEAGAGHCIATLSVVPREASLDDEPGSLRRRADLLGAALDVASIAAWRWHPDTDVVEVERPPSAETGRELQATSMADVLQMIVPEHRERVAGMVREALGDDTIRRYDFRLTHASGEIRWYSSSIRRDVDAAGRVTGLLGATRDVTLRKQWELALAQNEEWMRSILETAPELVAAFDPQGSLQLINRAGLAMVGADSAEAVRQHSLVELVAPGDRKAFTALHRRVLAGESGSLDFGITGLDGRHRWLEGNAAPLRDGEGMVSSVLLVARDVTARRRAEARLRVQAQILDTLSEGVVQLDADGTIRYCNPAFEDLLGRPRGSLTGTPARLLVDAPRSNLVRALASMREAGERPVIFELPLRHAAGGSRLVRIAVTAVAIGDARRWIGVAQDVTQRKQLEREIIEAAEREQERIGHDLHDGLGQELTGIALMLKGLHRQIEREAPAAADDLAAVLGLVNDAIRGTREIAHGLSPVAVERGGLVEALRTLARRADHSEGVRVRFRRGAWPAGRLELPVATHLYRIAQESLANALRHAQAAEIHVSLGSSPGRLDLRIVDDGRGLPPAGPLWEGLGLRIMRYRAQMIGATLRIGTRSRGGTEVHVSRPWPASNGEAGP